MALLYRIGENSTRRVGDSPAAIQISGDGCITVALLSCEHAAEYPSGEASGFPAFA